MEPQTIYSDDQYVIRALTASDAIGLHAAVKASLNELIIWMPWCSESYCLSDSEQYLSRCESTWTKNTEYNFCVFDVADDNVLGAIAINGIRHEEHCASIGYWTRSDATGRGIATLAARAVAVFGFNELGLKRLEILAQPTNHASRRVAEKLGGCFEGIVHDRIMFRGEPRAAVVYSLRPEDVRG
jgi:RimJ/RimL family protein N-acetyltransferase